MKKNKTSIIFILIITFLFIKNVDIVDAQFGGSVNCVVAGGGACTTTNIASQSDLKSLADKVAQETSLKKLITNIGGSSGASLNDTLNNIYADLETILSQNDALQLAKNNTAINMVKIANTTIKDYEGNGKGNPSKNVSTNGANFVGNMNNYLNKISINAIKKSLDPANLPDNPYTSQASKKIIQEFRIKTDETMPTISLPFIAQKEICNDTKLKNIIKNGEPAGWIGRKLALKNVNIDELCNANLTAKESSGEVSDQYKISSWVIPVNKFSKSADIENLKAFLFEKGYFKLAPTSNMFDSVTTNAVKAFQKEKGLDQSGEIDEMTQDAMLATEKKNKSVTGKAAQAAWISIANAGYGGPKTRGALADSSNSPSGQQSLIQSKIDNTIDTDIENAKTEFVANNGILADSTCIDKNGNVVNFDPTNEDISNSYCFDNIVTSTQSSALVKKENLAIAQKLLTSDLLSVKSNIINTKGENGSEQAKKDVTNENNTGFLDIMSAALNKDVRGSSVVCDKNINKAMEDLKKKNVPAISQKITAAMLGKTAGGFANSIVTGITGNSSLGSAAGNTTQKATDDLVTNVTTKAISSITNAATDFACAQTETAKALAKKELDKQTQNAKNALGQIISSQSSSKNITEALQKQINSAIDQANTDINSQINSTVKSKTPSVSQINYDDLSKYLDMIMGINK